MTPTLLVAAHGTRSVSGAASLRALADLVRRQRPGLPVKLCFLDVVSPSLAWVLSSVDGPAVVVPALLSTGYHVVDDIPARAAGRAEVFVAERLGPHPLLSEALADRLAEAGWVGDGPVALVGSGSRHPGARDDLAAAAVDLSGALGRRVYSLTVADELPADVTAAASYLLADGYFADQVRSRATASGVAISAPIGAHPAVAALILARYDDALAGPVVR